MKWTAGTQVEAKKSELIFILLSSLWNSYFALKSANEVQKNQLYEINGRTEGVLQFTHPTTDKFTNAAVCVLQNRLACPPNSHCFFKNGIFQKGSWLGRKSSKLNLHLDLSCSLPSVVRFGLLPSPHGYTEGFFVQSCLEPTRQTGLY